MTRMRLPPLPTIREIIRLYNLRARKHLSQNFLLDPILNRKIVHAAGNVSGAHVCEVGPGPGGITRAILEAGADHLTVIEKDRRFLPGLQIVNEASGNRMSIYQGDILRFDMENIFLKTLCAPWEENPPKIHIIGNLPFNVSTPLIIKWLEQMSLKTGAWSYGRTRLTLTFQEEVAERMVAPVNHSQRCRLSIMCQYLCHVKHKFTIKGKSFVPPPDVNAGVVHFTPRVEPAIDLPFRLVEKVVRHVFAFRQKLIKHGVQTLFPPDQPELTAQMFHDADVSPDLRSYLVTIKDFNRLCHAYKKICDQNPGLIDYYYRSEENAKEWRKHKMPLSV